MAGIPEELSAFSCEFSRFRSAPVDRHLSLSAVAGMAQTGRLPGQCQFRAAVRISRCPLSLDEALKGACATTWGRSLASRHRRRERSKDCGAQRAVSEHLSGGSSRNRAANRSGFLRIQIQLSAERWEYFVPTIVGPFNYFDLRGYLTQSVADVQAIRTYQSSREAQKAAEFSAADAREIVVYVVTAGYLQVLAESARVDSAKVQVDSAQAIFQQASDRFTAGLSAKIDMTRSQVELQTQQQRLTAEQADYDKQKIALARLIGLSSAQDVDLDGYNAVRAAGKHHARAGHRAGRAKSV